MSFPSSTGEVVPVIIGAFILAGILAFIATPLVLRIGHDLGFVDHPDPRKQHQAPLPRSGGIAVAIAFLAVGGGLVAFRDAIPGMPGIRGLSQDNVLGLFAGALLATVIGALDDRFDLRARWQFAGHLGVALVAIASGIVIANVGNPFAPGPIRFPPPLAVAITVVWVVGMINSLNFIDGLDGLSTGIALIAAATLGVLSLTTQVDQPLVAVLCFALAGALLGFLRWNFHPAVIFQGTAGVMLMGYALGVLSILGEAKVVVALLVLAVPIIDTFWVIVRRLSSGRSPFSPDRGHIHHRLLDLGLSHRATVLLILAVCATLGLMSLLVSSATGVLAFAAALVVFGAVAFLLRPGSPEPDSPPEAAP